MLPRSWGNAATGFEESLTLLMSASFSPRTLDAKTLKEVWSFNVGSAIQRSSHQLFGQWQAVCCCSGGSAHVAVHHTERARTEESIDDVHAVRVQSVIAGSDASTRSRPERSIPVGERLIASMTALGQIRKSL